MRLLVSVADPSEARAALEGGADVIDAKQPRRGALAPVRPDVLAAIRQVVGAARPVSAALGDARDEAAIERAAGVATGLGVAFVKVGFAGVVTEQDRKSTRLNSSHLGISYAVLCLKKNNGTQVQVDRLRLQVQHGAGAGPPPAIGPG